MAAKTKSKHDLARYLYTEANMSQVEIADFVGTSATQISRWKTKDKKQNHDWDALRKAHNLSSGQLIANAYEISQDIYEEAKSEKRSITSKEADVLVKLSTTIKNLERELNVQTATLVLQKFNDFLIQQNKLDLVKQFVEPQREFVLNLMPNE